MTGAQSPQASGNGDPGAQLILTIFGHLNPIRRLEFLPGGQRLVTVSEDGFVKIWDTNTGQQEGASMAHDGGVWDLALTSDGRRMLSSDEHGRITLWDVESRQLIGELTRADQFSQIAISPDDQLFACGRPIVVREMSAGQQVGCAITTVGGVSSLSFSPDEKKLAYGMEGIIRIHDIHNGALMLELRGHKGSVWHMLWSRNGNKLYSASDDNTVRCWNLETGEQIGRSWKGHTNYVYSISLSPDESTLASGSQDGTIRFWNTESGHPIGHPLEHEAAVWSVRISPSNDFVAAGRSDGAISLWRVAWLKSTQAAEIVNTPTPVALAGPQIGAILGSPDPPAHPPTGARAASSYVDEPSHHALDLTTYIIKSDDRYWEGGSFGDVYKCLYRADATLVEVAVKAFRFRFISNESENISHITKMIRRELGIWRRLDHANIVPFLGIATGFGMHGSLSLVSLWMPNGSLHQFLEDHDDQLSTAHRLQFLLDITNGLEYLHSFHVSPIVHGDLNTKNVLVDGKFSARLADFGYASVIGSIPEALTYLQRSTSRPGALRWSAPELILSEETPQKTPKNDIYSFGCIGLQVLSGKQPWSDVQEDGAIVVRMVKGQKPKRPESRAMDDRHWELIERCWSSVDERPTSEKLVSSLQEFLDCCPPATPLCDMFA